MIPIQPLIDMSIPSYTHCLALKNAAVPSLIHWRNDLGTIR